MTLKIADRVQETTATTGTGTLNLAGATTQMQSFISGIGNGNTTYYSIKAGNGTDWEIGNGTVTSGTPNTLSRDTILASSNSNSAISLTGTSTILAIVPANHAVQSLDFDNGFGSTRGQTLYRGVSGWTVIGPTTSGQVFVTNGPGDEPSWMVNPGSGTGLYNQVMSGTLTSTNSGLTTWINQASSTVADTTTGISIVQSGSGASLRSKAVPSVTPYSFKALIASNCAPGTAGNPSCYFGWYDGTAKLHMINFFYFNSATTPTIEVERWTSPTVFSSSADYNVTGVWPNPYWLRLRDDGTTAFFQYSRSGNSNDFLTLFSTTKSTSFLGSSGFANVFFGAAANTVTLMSFGQGD